MIYQNTSIGFLWRLRCVAITLSFVQMAAFGLHTISKTKFRQVLNKTKFKCYETAFL